MPFASHVRPLLLAIAASLAGLQYAAAHTQKMLSGACAGLLFAATVFAAYRSNAIILNAPVSSGTPPFATVRSALRQTTQFSVLVYAWAACALFLVYLGSGLIWQHGWQYGLALALVAFGLALYVRDLGKAGHWVASPQAIESAIGLAKLHGLLSAAVVCWLIASGKIATTRDDWAANHIFIACTAAIAILSAIAVTTHWTLSRRGPAGTQA